MSPVFRIVGKVIRLGLDVLVVALLTGWTGYTIFDVILAAESIIKDPVRGSRWDIVLLNLSMIPGTMLVSIFYAQFLLFLTIPYALITVGIQRFVRRSRWLAAATGSLWVTVGGTVLIWREFDPALLAVLAAFGALLGFAMPWRRLSRHWPPIAEKPMRVRIAEFFSSPPPTR